MSLPVASGPSRAASLAFGGWLRRALGHAATVASRLWLLGFNIVNRWPEVRAKDDFAAPGGHQWKFELNLTREDIDNQIRPAAQVVTALSGTNQSRPRHRYTESHGKGKDSGLSPPRSPMNRKLLVTGSNGLIGSEVCLYFAARGFTVHGLDNNQRAVFFGPAGDTRWNQRRLQQLIPRFQHHEVDVRDREGIQQVLRQVKPDVIVHTAAQPSHDLAATIPFDDFDTNATGTLNLLEGARRHCPESPFIHMSTNKVYGDAPNSIALKELETRWEYADEAFVNGIPETFPIDQSRHSLFGASKAASDILVQEYGRYFSIPSCCLRGGCLTGPNHAGVELHGFLSYLVRCNIEGKEYRVYGYKGKQVRDNIHSEDVAAFMYHFYLNPRCGEVYNVGGGKDNSCSILEAFGATEAISGRRQRYTYVDQNRIGDHICYYSDLRKMRSHYPHWSITKDLTQITREIVESWQVRLPRGSGGIEDEPDIR